MNGLLIKWKRLLKLKFEIKYKKILLVLLLVILFWLDCTNCFLRTIPININFWSAMLGTIATIVAVYLTIRHESKKSKEDLINSHRPYLQYFISIGIYPYRTIDQNRRTVILNYEFSAGQEDGKCLIFPLDVINIGLGVAFIEKIEVLDIDNVEPLSESTREKIVKKDGNSVFYVKVINIKEDDIKKLRIKVYYHDFFGTKYSDILKVAVDKKSDEVQVFDKTRAKDALKQYLEKCGEKISNKSDYEAEINKVLDSGNFIVKELEFEEMNKYVSSVNEKSF